MPERDETTQPTHAVPLDEGGYGCPVPGAEAEELRQGIEALEQSGGASSAELRSLLDRVNARDSLAYLEQRDKALDGAHRALDDAGVDPDTGSHADRLERRVRALVERWEGAKRSAFHAINEAARVAQDREPGHLLLQAIQAVQATSADHYDPDSACLVRHVNTHLRAIEGCEAALREHLSARELWRLLQVLIDMHADPLDNTGDLDNLITYSEP